MQNLETQTGFEALRLSPPLVGRLASMGITEPTPIQASAIPVALEGRDVIGIAQTGTGKTMAFLIPLVERLAKGQAGLVLAPTRELAQQIQEACKKLNVPCALVVGGAPFGPQIRSLRSRPPVIVATPGRLMDLMDQDVPGFDRVCAVVLDEADRMLDMGFAPAIRRILSALPRPRQIMLFSATMPPEIASIAQDFMKSPARVEAAHEGAVSDLVDHELLWLSFEDKPKMLAELLDENGGPILVFSRTRHGARKLAQVIRDQGHAAEEIHADRSLAQRREALHGFRTGRTRILVATDIAARGIDVKEISLVVNYDLPDNPDDYIHRIGRTGRAGSKGRAVSLALLDQKSMVREIERRLGLTLKVSERSTISVVHAQPRQRPQPRRFGRVGGRRG